MAVTYVQLVGCDATTYLTVETNGAELAFLARLAEQTRRDASGCEPTLAIAPTNDDPYAEETPA